MLTRTLAVALLTLGCGGRVSESEPGSEAGSVDTGEAVDVADAAAPAPGAAQAALGLYHGCAIRSGRVRCFGANGLGQLGNGTGIDSSSPVDVPGLEDVLEIAATDYTTCARTRAGETFCWGSNSVGQAGIGSDAAIVPRPQRVALASAVHLAAGSLHFCAVLEDGTVWCWGGNRDNQLGRAASEPAESCGSRLPCRRTPGPVETTTRFLRVAAGAAHSCAIALDGRVWCWGHNDVGQLGDETTVDRPTPVATSVFATQLVAGTTHHTCAIDRASKIWCWGSNSEGALGLGTVPLVCTGTELAFSSTPRKLSLDRVRSVVAAGNHTCAENGASVFCWGSNNTHVLGVGLLDGRRPECSAAPVPVRSLPAARDLLAGIFATCATLEATGVRHCWGTNFRGSLGDGPAGDYPLPTIVSW